MRLRASKFDWTLVDIEGASICDAEGFEAAGIACGIKHNGERDLALLHCKVPANVAGVFTRNLVKGHSLLLTADRVKSGNRVRALAINSGNANACVGVSGNEDALHIAAAAAESLGIEAEQVLFGSTGVIGQPLPTDKIITGLQVAARELHPTTAGGHKAMEAIMTTDLLPKEVAVRAVKEGQGFTIAGMAKGSGMIHPNMATMIAVLATDARINRNCLQEALDLANAGSFNRISVDGDTSPCDMVLLLSSGLANNEEITSLKSDAGQAFLIALKQVSRSLAKQVVRDGEGAGHLVTIEVEGASTPEDAYQLALAVAKSPLVKTAIFGSDANWGRIITAAGYSGAKFDPAKIDIYIGSIQCCRAGAALDFDEVSANEILKEEEVLIRIDLNGGKHSDHYWTCDFSYDYIRINGSYRS